MKTETAPIAASGSSRELLVVDDHDGVRMAICEWLTMTCPGLRVQSARDAEFVRALAARLGLAISEISLVASLNVALNAAGREEAFEDERGDGTRDEPRDETQPTARTAEVPSHGGRPRLYASDAERTAAYRLRKQARRMS